jgi:hypothetical protein
MEINPKQEADEIVELSRFHPWTYPGALNPSPNDLVAGTYTLGVDDSDADTWAEIYSNAVTLTVLP